MSGSPARTAPPPGQAPMPAPHAAALVVRNAVEHGDRPAIHFGDRTWSHAEFLAESTRFGGMLRDRRPATGPFHVAAFLDNTPDYLFLLGGAALVGAAVVGLNHTRHGEHLRRDITHTDCGILVTETRHQDQVSAALEGTDVDPGLVVVSGRFDDGSEAATVSIGVDLDHELATAVPAEAPVDLDPGTPWALIFTSGTSSAPKAVICSQRRLMVTGNRLGMLMGVTRDDVAYVCMPLFHSNALMVGWAPAVVHGASVALARRFSASRFLPDVRRHGATWFNYTGKPLSYILATPEQPDDADNPLRIAYGNEGSPRVVAEFGRRFGVEVVDAFGATEGGVAVDRSAPPREGALGMAGPTVKVVDEAGRELPPARFDTGGRLLNPDECVGEIVNTAGTGPFEGYYNNPEATERTTRDGWFWSGDLGYLDADGYLYFAGRTAEWIRVDGENFPAAPIEAALSRHPDVAIAAVYGVPDVHAGDQVMAAVILREGARFDPAGFATWLDDLPDIGPKWRPRYVRVAHELPSTGTNKVVKRTLVTQKWRLDLVGGDEMWVRERGETAYRRFTEADHDELAAAFAAAGRQRFWDL